MLKIGITGQAGFIGKHLQNNLGLAKELFQLIEFEKSFFEDQKKLNDFVSQCDVIVHLAAMNRHNDPNVIYETNITLVQKLVNALKVTNSKAHVLFSSSTQEEKDNLYGQSKREGRGLLSTWAKESGGRFTGFIIPNVFGPFGLPNYNSVVATFCYKLTHNEMPLVETDGVVKLIYVGELVDELIAEIRNEKTRKDLIEVLPTTEIKVSSILSLLQNFKKHYFEKGSIPLLSNKFEQNLFNTFCCYIDLIHHFPVNFESKVDSSGTTIDVLKPLLRGRVSFSSTLPGSTRGNNFHTYNIVRLAVIKGSADIQLRQIGTDEMLNFQLDGNKPGYVDVPIWHTYRIQNIGRDDLLIISWISEFFDMDTPNTFFENV